MYLRNMTERSKKVVLFLKISTFLQLPRPFKQVLRVKACKLSLRTMYPPGAQISSLHSYQLCFSFCLQNRCAMDEIADKGELLVMANLAEQAERYEGE